MNEQAKILIVDDEESMRNTLRILLQKESYEIFTSENAEEAVKIVSNTPVDLVITDIQLGPGMNGVELLKKIKLINRDTIVLLITAYATVETAIVAFREGAWDYVLKPFDIDEIRIKISKALEKKKLESEVVRLKKELRETYSFQNIIGKNNRIREIFELIERVATTDTSILITGESGTGKDLVAKAIHYSSHRKDGPFVSVNCPAIPETLMESEMFGHTKGSFTGAIKDKKGLIEQANMGTIFLNEIGELSLHMQVKLLAVLQEKKMRRVGDNKEIKSDFRLITATNRDLSQEIERGNFRDDLWYRINVVQIDMPPLRERPDDIALLVDFYFSKFREQSGKKIKKVSKDVINMLEKYSWPGNIRELVNVMERAVTLETSDEITVDSIPEKIVKAVSGEYDQKEDIKLDDFNLDEYINNEYVKYLKLAMEREGGVQTKAAEFLNIPVRSLRYLLEKYNIK